MCVDKLTKYTILIPCTLGEGELSSQQVADLFFEHVVCRFGVPRAVLHDRDPRFTAGFWRTLWERLGTRVKFSSAFHPQTDGQTERQHRTIEQVLRCLLSANRVPESEWVSFLPHVALALNNTVADATGKAPNELVLGQLVDLPTDHVLDTSQNVAGSVAVERINTWLQEAQAAIDAANRY